MRLKFPHSFKIDYPKENLLYYNRESARKKISTILIEACDGYCMYCGKNIIVDNKDDFNIEHSLEKSMNVDDNNFLENCKYNLSIACPSCNQKYKTRMIDVLPREYFEENIDCSQKQCTEICKEYNNAFNKYIKINNIILQPNSLKNGLNEYIIQYNLISNIFEPGYECDDPKVKNFISNHIARFHLNREMYTKSVLKICEEICKIIDILGKTILVDDILKIVKKERYENILEKIFIEFLQNNLKNTKVLYQYCKFTLILSYL